MEEVYKNTYEAPVDNLFDDDFFHKNDQMASSSNFLPEESIQAQCFQDEYVTNHKPDAKNPKPGEIAANLQQERRPWLKRRFSIDQTNFGNEVAKQKPKMLPPAVKKGKKKQDNRDRTLYQNVMEEVANKTLGAFLKHYGDDSVHVRFQQLWKSKMKEKKVEIGRFAGQLPPAGVATPLNGLNPPYGRVGECGEGVSYSKEKAPSETTTSIPLQGQSIQFQCFPTYQDGNERSSKSAAHKLRELGFCKKQQQGGPWLENAGFEGPIPREIKLRNHAKKQELRQPWLKQKPFDNQNNAVFQETISRKYD